MICSSCGAQISNKSVYCPLCGIKLKEEPVEAAAEEAAEETTESEE